MNSTWTLQLKNQLKFFLLTLCFFAVQNFTLAQCVPDVTVVVDGPVDIVTGGPDSCSVSFNYLLANNGQCNVSAFEINITISSTDGVENYTELIAGGLAAGATLPGSLSYASEKFYDDMDMDCFSLAELTIALSVSTTTPPVSLTEIIACPGQLGTMVVCLNDNAIVCDDSGCVDPPIDCNPYLLFNVDYVSATITPTPTTECQLDFNAVIENIGSCNVGTFDVDVQVISPEGLITSTETITGPLVSGGTYSFPVSIVSAMLYNDMTMSCFDVADLTIVVTASAVTPPSVMTVVVACPSGNGMMTVCANDYSVACDMTGCDAPSDTGDCAVSLTINDNVSVIDVTPFDATTCTADFELQVINSGVCDLNSFNVEITITTPNGSEVITQTIPGPIGANSLVVVPFSHTTDIFNAMGPCVDVSQITAIAEIGTIAPSVATVEVPCATGTGTTLVCANNTDIICDDTACVPLPETCEVIVDIDILEDMATITPLGLDSCTLKFDVVVNNNGGCDLAAFDLIVLVTNEIGETESAMPFGIPSILSDGSFVLTYCIGSDVFYDDTNMDCWGLGSLSIEANVSTVNPATIITETVPCAMGVGTMEVCANNNDIICDNTGCVPVPETCEIILDFDPVLSSVVITDDGTGSCTISFDLNVSNNGGCDVTRFDFDIWVTTPEGTYITTLVVGPLASDATVTVPVSGSSAFFYDDANGTCFDVSDLSFVGIPSTGMGPEPITIEVPCLTGTGTMMVCANNNAIICSDENCIPDPPSCDVNVALDVDKTTLELEQVGMQCQVQFQLEVKNSGACDVSGFEVDYIITSPSSTYTNSFIVIGPIPGGTTVNMPVTSLTTLLTDPMGICYDPTDLTLNVSISLASPPTTLTQTVACPSGTGTMEVCVNDATVICDDTACMTMGSCENNIAIAVNNATVNLVDDGPDSCFLNFMYDVSNNGDCNVSGFEINFTINTPAGVETYTEIVPGPINAGTTTSFSFSKSSDRFKNGATCYTTAVVSISFLIGTPPAPITMTVACPTGAGTIEVCANDVSITCGDCDVVLALDILNFSALAENNKVRLSWSAETDDVLSYFELEHKSENGEFEVIHYHDALNTKGLNAYEYLHIDPFAGSNYYRLKQISQDGTFKYAPIRQVSMDKTNDIALYPNPASDVLNVIVEDEFENNQTIQIFDITGKVILSLPTQNGERNQSIDVSNLIEGAYILRIGSENKIQTKRFVKH